MPYMILVYFNISRVKAEVLRIIWGTAEHFTMTRHPRLLGILCANRKWATANSFVGLKMMMFVNIRNNRIHTSQISSHTALYRDVFADDYTMMVLWEFNGKIKAEKKAEKVAKSYWLGTENFAVTRSWMYTYMNLYRSFNMHYPDVFVSTIYSVGNCQPVSLKKTKDGNRFLCIQRTAWSTIFHKFPIKPSPCQRSWVWKVF